MKKIFTLIAATLMAVGANAQKYYFADSDIQAKDEANKPLNGKTYGDGFVTLIDEVGKMSIDANDAYFGDATAQTKFTHRLKSGAKSQTGAGKHNQVNLTVSTAGTLKVYVRTGSNDATDRNVVITQGSSELFNGVVKESDAVTVAGLDESDPTKETKVYPIISVEVAVGAVEITYPVGSINFYGFEVSSTTGITDVKVVEPSTVKDDAIYNLSGQKVNKNYKGVVIKNGVKTIQK